MSTQFETNPPADAVDQIDAVCDEFESKWLRNERPQIGDYLEKVDGSQRTALFRELLFVEVEYRLKLGESPTIAEYRSAYPAYAGEIEAAGFAHGGSVFATASKSNGDTVVRRTQYQGKRIDHFELLECLGTGAMGEVWKAWDPRLRREVAMKLPREAALSDVELQRFLREGQATAQLRHPQLSTIHEAGRANGTAYLVSDYFEGENLKVYLSSRDLGFAEKATLCAEVAEALHYAHEEGVVHRDLKPANIIVNQAGRPHVIDFGLAKWRQDDRELTLHGELLGTPAYMSPEQARGEGAKADRTTDIFSLGVMLYELITGQCPFGGDRAAVFHQILNEAPKAPRALNSKVPRDLETICLKALEKEPQRRYATAQEMAVDLRRFVRGEPILARRTGLLEKGWRLARRRPAWAAALILAIAAVVAGLMAFSARETNRRLLGYKTVAFDTEPPGARVAFARLNEFGELLPDEITKPSDVTPVRVELLPGDYFVEVLWPDGRFHQVYRHVPGADESSYVSTHRCMRWLNLSQGLGIGWLSAPAPTANAADGMKLVQARGTSPIVADFYVDVDAVSSKMLRDKVVEARWLPHISDKPKSFASAADAAELTGARLPTRFEYLKLSSEAESRSPVFRTTDAEQPDTLMYKQGIVRNQGFRRVRSAKPMFLP